MNDKVIKVYKQCGSTPLECINNLKKEDEKLIDTKFVELNEN